MFGDDNLAWLSEKIDHLEFGNWLYKILVFFTRRKWTYGELYLFLVELNRSKIGEEKARRMAMKRVLETYKFLNDNKYPDGIDEEGND